MSAAGGRVGFRLLCALVVLTVVGATGAAGGGGPAGPTAAGGTSGAAVDGAVDRTPLQNPSASSDEDEGVEAGREESDAATFAVDGLDDRAITILNARSGPSGPTPRNAAVTVTVRNTGNGSGSTWVELYLRPEGEPAAGDPIERTRVTLAPDEATTVTFRPLELYATGPGNHTLSVRAGDAVDRARFGVYYPQFTYFRLGTVDDATVRPGETATLSIHVENTGRPPGVYRESLRSPGLGIVSATVNGSVVDATAVWLGVGESTAVELSVPADALAPGDNRVVVASAAEGDRRLDEQVRPTVSLLTPSDGEDGAGFGLLLPAGAIALAVALAVALFVRGR